MHRILVVEDDIGLRDALVFVLERDGHDVAGAADGFAALRVLQQKPFDLVITDVIMPGMDGIELLRALRGRQPKPRVIAMSGGGRNAAMDYLAMALVLGADAIVSKPVSADELREEITRVMLTSEAS